ncbi:MAG: hypothetical protein FWC85_02815 [Elusimicrobia bacterium]|nr:hypothetical protein [Elusimicrobiota bacterium]
MDKEKLKREIVKRLAVIDMSKPPFLSLQEHDKLAYLRRYFDDFLISLKRAGAIKNWYYGIDLKNPFKVKIKVVLENVGVYLKNVKKIKESFFYYDVELKRS